MVPGIIERSNQGTGEKISEACWHDRVRVNPALESRLSTAPIVVVVTSLAVLALLKVVKDGNKDRYGDEDEDDVEYGIQYLVSSVIQERASRMKLLA